MWKASNRKDELRMITAEFKIREIDYEQSFSSLFPAVLKKCGEMEKENLLIHQKIGDAAGTFAEKFGGGIFRHIAAGSANLAANAFVNIMPDGVERRMISMMEREESKGKLLSWAAGRLKNKGVCLELEDLSFMQMNRKGADEAQSEIGKKEKLEISWDLKEELLDAAAEYLKSLLNESGWNTD